MSRRWWIGLVAGAASGAIVLIAGPVGAVLAVASVLLAAAERPRQAAIGGVLIGLGGAWFALFGRVAVTCRAPDCGSPDLTPWLAVAVTCLVAGAAVTVWTRRS